MIMGEYRGVSLPDFWDQVEADSQDIWKSGVDAAQKTSVVPDDGDVKLEVTFPTRVDRDLVRAFAHVVKESPDMARIIVRSLSGRDRAVLLYHLEELRQALQDEDLRRRHL